MPIDSVEDLRDHIAVAIAVELSTIPPYLYAMYSIADRSSEASLLIRSIVAEEMLHAALASNLLLAVGGEPDFASTALIPAYPQLLPHHSPPLELSLGPASLDLVRDVLMRIEQPEAHGAPPEPDVFETLGQFYHALTIAIDELSAASDIFSDPQVRRQLADPSFYSPVAFDAEDSGGLMAVVDRATADEAIEIIVHQGEGLSEDRWADPGHHELTHYHKLLQIAEGISPLGEVRAVPTDPRVADYPEPIQPAAHLFNAAYRYTYLLLDELLGPSPDKTEHVSRLYTIMASTMSSVAYWLVEQPIGDGLVAAPTFEVYEFSGDPVAELAALATEVAPLGDELADIAEPFAQL